MSVRSKKQGLLFVFFDFVILRKKSLSVSLVLQRGFGKRQLFPAIPVETDDRQNTQSEGRETRLFRRENDGEFFGRIMAGSRIVISRNHR